MSRTLARASGFALLAALLHVQIAVAQTVNFESFTTQTFAGPAAAGSFNVTTIPGFNRYLVVGYQHERSATPARQVTSLTYGGAPLTLAHREVNPSTQEVSEIWYLANPTIGSASLSATLDGASESGRGFRLTAINLSGAAQTAPESATGSSVNGNASSTPYTTLTDNALLLGFTHHQATSAHTPGAGVTELFDINAVSISAALGTKTEVIAGTSSFDWAWTGGAGASLNSNTVAAIAPLADPVFIETPVSVDIGQVNQTSAGIVQSGFVAWDFPDDVASDTLTLTDPFGTGNVNVTLSTDTGVFGTSTGTRDRGPLGPTTSPLDSLLRDFVFESDGSLVTLTFDNLPAGDYAIETYHYDDDFQLGDADVYLSDDAASNLLIGNAGTDTNADLPLFGAFSTFLLSNGVDPVSLTFDTNSSFPFTGFTLTLLEVPAVPEPSTIAVWSLLGLALCGFGCLRRRGRQQR